MDQEIEKTVQAIAIASDPLQGSLHQEALAYLSSVQQNANETWRLAVPLFFDANQDGTRKYPPQARFFALRVLDEFLDNRCVCPTAALACTADSISSSGLSTLTRPISSIFSRYLCPTFSLNIYMALLRLEQHVRLL